MSVPEFLLPHFDALPHEPGVYVFKDEADRELYVGKAKDLKKRVRQYFDPKRIDRKTQDLVARIRKIEFIACDSEVEAYLVENRLIKDFQPPFNFFNKSDMNFPVVEITWGEEFPRVLVTRDRSNPKSTYYGPFVSVTWLRTALQIMQRVFKYRTCSLDIREDDPKNRFYRPCLEHYIGRCKAPCAARQSAADYRADMRRLSRFLAGEAKDVRKDLEREMWQKSSERRFEEAAALRDSLKALESLAERGSLDDGLEPGVLHLDPQEGVEDLKQALGLSVSPRHVEGIDIAHLHGTETVGSLVSFVDGLPSRERYRRYRIKSVVGVDDFASIGEVVKRRYGRLMREGGQLPDLILIDGGIGQLHAARDALRAAGVDTPALASLAKQEEIIHTLEHPEGIRLPRRNAALRMLQYVRDEAHRFAQHYHHILRRKRVLHEE
ncbi:MAG: excinuclease ABC subunit UvrC [Planctomycetes bacterium]|nr:excinuclease ABC subunit UvrC [Planctomycetota bacterium]